MKRAAVYARVSTSDQTVDSQLDALRSYCQRRGLEAVEFIDHGVSGAKDKRPALDAMLCAVRRREVDCVVITKLDRLARSVRHLCELADAFEKLGVQLIALDQDLNTATSSGRLLFGVLAVVAQFERDLIRERTRAGLAAAKRRGTHCGRPVTATTDERRARAQRMRESGQSLRYIAGVLGVSAASVHRMLSEGA
jgi:DNA invertase Pin-like site-specific DNA recombinase